ncbi:MAG TPA: outer membrane beta-barrel protein, partial [Chitinophagaceae bacterium]|nr:outer membrane beta-barrel protein [Chitinophagaceae bacterium]
MKRTFLLLSLCIITASAIAQQQRTTTRSTKTPSFYFGGGPTFSEFTGDQIYNPSILVGAQVALGMPWKISNNFSVVPELNVAMEGTKWDEYPGQSYRLWYLNIPVTARYQFSNTGLYAETGPQLGLLLDATKKEVDKKNDIKDAFKTTSVNWVFGLGYNFGG